MKRLRALFLMQDPGKKFNMLVLKKTKQRKPPKPTLCQGTAAWMPKVKPASGYGCWDHKVHIAQVLTSTCKQHRHHLKCPRLQLLA